ncbi:MAG: CBS domain-containing protein [Roseiflexaceae bacterium]|nr:CBS domain-containing protein [Roseiflexaceae bacterium]
MERVRTWMSSPAISALHTTMLPDARQLMQAHHIRRLPVVDTDGRLVGIVTEGDVNRVSDSQATDVREYNLYHRVRDLPIREIMSRPVFSVEVDTPILVVAQLMLEHRIGGIPVTENGRVVGIITESDLFRLIVKRQLDQAWQSVQG